MWDCSRPADPARAGWHAAETKVMPQLLRRDALLMGEVSRAATFLRRWHGGAVLVSACRCQSMCFLRLRQDAVVARQYLSDLKAFERQARDWTGARHAAFWAHVLSRARSFASRSHTALRHHQKDLALQLSTLHWHEQAAQHATDLLRLALQRRTPRTQRRTGQTRRCCG